MTVTVTYYGLLAERRGIASEVISTTAEDPASLYAEIDSLHLLGLSTSAFRVAVNDEFVPWSHPLAGNDSVAFLPPMSGG